MNIVQIKCFCSVAFSGSFSDTAEQLYMSQSSVSRNVQSLEQELGLKLFVRNGKYFSLSEEGRKMLRYFTELLNTYNKAIEALERIKGRKQLGKTILRVAGDLQMSKYGIINSLVKFAEENSDISLSVDECGDDTVRYSLQADDCDIAFCTDFYLDSKNLSWKKYFAEEYVVMVSSASPLANSAEVKIEDLKNFEIVLNLPKPNYDSFMETCIRQYGYHPNVVINTQETPTAMQFLFSRSDVVCVTLKTVARFYGGTKTKTIHLGGMPGFNYLLVWKKKQPVPEKVQRYIKYLELHDAEEFISENLRIRREGQ